MEILILDEEFRNLKAITSFYSLLWVIRYNAVGDFEWYIPFDSDILASLQKGEYLYLGEENYKTEDKRLMIIEDINLSSNFEEGIFIIITGRSLESILTRRIVWKHTSFIDTSLRVIIETLLNENLINPVDLDRKIDNFILSLNQDASLDEIKIETQLHGEELYDVIYDICNLFKVGFKVILNDNDVFEFELYTGQDRSYDQLDNPYVIFSSQLGNLKESVYREIRSNYKNSALIAGEGEGVSRTVTDVGEFSGLDRRELFVDASGTSRDSTPPVSLNNYIEQLKELGMEGLADRDIEHEIEANLDVSRTYKYGQHFKLGDILQVKNEFGMEVKVRVMEMIFSQGMEGYNVYPTFEIID